MFKHFIPLYVICLLLYSCDKPSSSIERYGDSKALVVGDTISFPVDEETYYASKSIFQFEENGKEFLFFKNLTNKGGSKAIIFNIEKERVHKTFPLYREVPNGIPSISGVFPIDMNHSLITSSSRLYIVND